MSCCVGSAWSVGVDVDVGRDAGSVVSVRDEKSDSCHIAQVSMYMSFLTFFAKVVNAAM